WRTSTPSSTATRTTDDLGALVGVTPSRRAAAGLARPAPQVRGARGRPVRVHGLVQPPRRPLRLPWLRCRPPWEPRRPRRPAMAVRGLSQGQDADGGGSCEGLAVCSPGQQRAAPGLAATSPQGAMMSQPPYYSTDGRSFNASGVGDEISIEDERVALEQSIAGVVRTPSVNGRGLVADYEEITA